MAITTTNGKLAIMEFGQVWEPGLPMSPGAIDQADQQQFLWGFPEILWEVLDEVMIRLRPIAPVMSSRRRRKRR